MNFITKMFAKESGKIVARDVAKQTTITSGAAFAATMGAMKMSKKYSETKFVSKYRKQHPETKLSNNEILKIKDQRDYHMLN